MIKFLLLSLLATALAGKFRDVTRDPRLQTTTPAKDIVETCEKDGRRGECVLYYQCDEDGNIRIDIDIEAVPNIVNPRFAQPCRNYLEVCCFLQKKGPSPPPEIRKGCGWRNPNGVGFSITGATDGETNYGEFPWMVAVQKKVLNIETNGLEIYTYLAGGSLIHPSVVLTMAHGVYLAPKGSLRARLGEWDTFTQREQHPHQERDVRETVLHPEFDRKRIHVDAALLFLSSPVTPAPHIGVACLAPIGARAAAGTRCFATGWGKDKFEHGRLPTILKRVEVPVVEQGQCQAALRRSRLGRHFELHSSFMCAGGEDQDTCKGDGGSPLVCPSTTTDRFVQHGIVSWGIGCRNEFPGVYTDVGSVRAWIDETVRAHGFDPSVYTLDASEDSRS